MANVNGGLVSQNQNKQQPIGVKNILANLNMKKRFEDILGKKAQGFIASIVNISTEKLKDVEPYSVVSSAMIAATLDLPIDPNLGHAWIVPFKDHGVKKAQFQMAAKGFVQLAQRSGQYKKINKGEVYENQFKSWNPYTEELVADFSVRGEGKIIGYFSYFELLNGFTKTVFWYKEEVTEHAKRYSKSFGNGPWQTNFDAMAEKTVIKYMLKEYGPLSIEMQTAIMADQAVVKNEVANGADISGSFEYPDNPENVQDVEFTESESKEYEGTPFEDQEN